MAGIPELLNEKSGAQHVAHDAKSRRSSAHSAIEAGRTSADFLNTPTPATSQRNVPDFGKGGYAAPPAVRRRLSQASYGQPATVVISARDDDLKQKSERHRRSRTRKLRCFHPSLESAPAGRAVRQDRGPRVSPRPPRRRRTMRLCRTNQTAEVADMPHDPERADTADVWSCMAALIAPIAMRMRSFGWGPNPKNDIRNPPRTALCDGGDTFRPRRADVRAKQGDAAMSGLHQPGARRARSRRNVEPARSINMVDVEPVILFSGTLLLAGPLATGSIERCPPNQFAARNASQRPRGGPGGRHAVRVRE
jgi:hypothetical protein